MCWIWTRTALHHQFNNNYACLYNIYSSEITAFCHFTKLRCTIVDKNYRYGSATCYTDIKSHMYMIVFHWQVTITQQSKQFTYCVSLCLFITTLLDFKDSCFPVSLRPILDTSGMETVLSNFFESVPASTQTLTG